MDQQDTYKFSRKFRLKILALCLDDIWMSKFGNYIIKSEYFERDDERVLAKAILEFRDRYNKSPRDSEDVLVLDGGLHEGFIRKFFRLQSKWDLDLAGDEAIEFARDQAAKLAILDSVDDVLDGNMSTAIDRMKQALRVGQDVREQGITISREERDYKWLFEYWVDKIPTGWPHIDWMLEGGAGPGEEGVILGPQNRGKSMSLINIGYAAASLLTGTNVVHFSHEMKQSQVAKRYAARMVFRFPQRDDDLDLYAEEMIEAARRLLKGKIKIISGTMTIEDIEHHLERLDSEGFEIGLIVDDYADLIHVDRYFSDNRFKLSYLYTWFREIGDYWNVPVWTASQARRESHSKEIITMQDVAEDIGKASIADIIISLCQTYEERMANQCRLYMAKVRDGESLATVEAKYYNKSQAIVSTGYVEYETGEEDDV